MVEFAVDRKISTGQFAEILRRSTLAERRPVDDEESLQAMLAEASLLVTAWQGEQLVGVARSLTDFRYCCYLSDLAVDVAHQRRGIGRQLIQQTRDQLGDGCTLILLAAPAAREYYPHLGFERHESAWILPPQVKII